MSRFYLCRHRTISSDVYTSARHTRATRRALPHGRPRSQRKSKAMESVLITRVKSDDREITVHHIRSALEIGSNVTKNHCITTTTNAPPLLLPYYYSVA